MDVPANYKKKKGDYYKSAMKRVNASRKRLFKIVRRAKGEKIFVFHYPPYGTFDKIQGKNNPYRGGSAGIMAFREAILKFKPKLALCGHMHEYQGAKKIGKTIVVNPGDAERGRFAVIDYPEMKIKFFR
jgi:Icc-related predicted phosphoesterase